MADAQTWLTGAALLVSAMSPILLALINRTQRQGIKAAAEKAEEVRTDLRETAHVQSQELQATAQKVEAVRVDLREQGAVQTQEIKAIHTAVNSERAAMVAEIAALRKELLGVSQDKAVLQADASAAARNRRATDPKPGWNLP
jgi:hypothetical protein